MAHLQASENSNGDELRFTEHQPWDEKLTVEESREGDSVLFREVAVLGLLSANEARNGKKRQYTKEAVSRAIPLYEGARVYLDHNGPLQAASVDRLAGKLEGIYWDDADGKLRARQLEIQKTPKTTHALTMMRAQPDHVGLSHDILGKESAEGEITEISRVFSVDVVAAPATNSGLYEAKKMVTLGEAIKRMEEAVWTTEYRNDLPDSAFLYIGKGGEKDGEGKTTPRSLRKFPYKDDAGKVDLPHLRNALARLPQSDISAEEKAKLTKKAQAILSETRGEESVATANPSEGKAFTNHPNKGETMDESTVTTPEGLTALKETTAELEATKSKLAEAEARAEAAEAHANKVESRLYISEALASSSLPEISRERLAESLAGKTEEEVAQAVADETSYIEAIRTDDHEDKPVAETSVRGAGPSESATTPVKDSEDIRNGVLSSLGFSHNELKEVR